MSSPQTGPDDTEVIARTLSGDPRQRKALELAELLVRSGHGRDLLKKLMECFGSYAQESVPPTMKVLEEAAGVSPRVAAYLMARLYPIASRVSDHDVFHSIEFWMEDRRFDAVADVLRALAREGVSRSLARKYEAWARAIEERETKL